MKRKVAQRETQRAYVHALSYSGSHIREKERRPGRTSKRFATAEISMRSALHTPLPNPLAEKPNFCFSPLPQVRPITSGNVGGAFRERARWEHGFAVLLLHGSTKVRAGTASLVTWQVFLLDRATSC